jgi:hypothetical protein
MTWELVYAILLVVLITGEKGNVPFYLILGEEIVMTGKHDLHRGSRWLVLICLAGLAACQSPGPESDHPEQQPPDNHGLLAEGNFEVRAVYEYLHKYRVLPRVQFDLLARLQCNRSLGEDGSLETRLEQCGWLRDNMIWETGTGERVSYPFWTAEQKSRLDELFQALERGTSDLGLSCPDMATRGRTLGTPYNVVLTAREAFDIYAAHVAHALHLEATAGVPWSLYSLPMPELAELLSSDRYHMRIIPSTLHSTTEPYYPIDIEPDRDFQLTFSARMVSGRALNCDPRVGYRFARGFTSTSGEDLVRATQEETLVRLSRWFAENVVHSITLSDLRLTPANKVQYGLLENRLKAQSREGDSSRMIVAPLGCQFSVNLLHDVARALNLPLLRIKTAETPTSLVHQGLVFRWSRGGRRFLHHIDDLYANRMNLSFPLRADGTEPSGDEAAQIFFDTLWSPPDRTWGINLTGDYSVVPVDPASTSTDNPNTGVYGAYWDSSDEFLAFITEQQYRLGSWDNYLSEFCDLPAQFDIIVRPRTSRSRSVEMHREHAAATVLAYGGCATLVRRANDFVNAVRGSNVLRE